VGRKHRWAHFLSPKLAISKKTAWRWMRVSEIYQEKNGQLDLETIDELL
jgi:hypothetical protein